MKSSWYKLTLSKPTQEIVTKQVPHPNWFWRLFGYTMPSISFIDVDVPEYIHDKVFITSKTQHNISIAILSAEEQKDIIFQEPLPVHKLTRLIYFLLNANKIEYKVTLTHNATIVECVTNKSCKRFPTPFEALKELEDAYRQYQEKSK